jgi:hypothetical protein
MKPRWRYRSQYWTVPWTQLAGCVDSSARISKRKKQRRRAFDWAQHMHRPEAGYNFQDLIHVSRLIEKKRLLFHGGSSRSKKEKSWCFTTSKMRSLYSAKYSYSCFFTL